MKGFALRVVVLIVALAILECLGIAEEESESNTLSKGIYETIIIHSDGYRMNEEGEQERTHGWRATRELIETSSDLITDVSNLPNKFKRPENTKVIFRHGDWGLVASTDGEWVVSIDGLLTVDLSESRISTIIVNWKPTDDIEIAYRLAIDDEHELQSKYRAVSSGYVPHHSWQNVSEEFVKEMENGRTRAVSLIDKDEEDVFVEELSLTGFSESLIAVRKLLKDSPRAERED